MKTRKFMKTLVSAAALAMVATAGSAVAEENEAGTTYKFGGYAKFDAMWSDYSDGNPPSSAIIRQFYIPSQIPVGDGSGSGDVTADFQGRESRIFFRADTTTAGGNKLGAYIEIDFFTHSDGNEIVSNSYSPRLRHAFVKFDKWLFGQTWSTFQDVGALPEALDFIGPAESTTFIRQAQVRYTNGNLELAAENPETFVHGAAEAAPGHDTIPDLVGRYTFKLDGGHYVKIAGLVRFLNIDEQPVGVAASETAFGLSASARFKVGEQDDIRAMVTYGDGIGRYLGLGIGRDGAVDGLGDGIDLIKQTAGFVSFRHFWNDKYRSNIMIGHNTLDVPVTAGNVSKEASSFHVNLIYNPLPKLDIGAELMWAERKLVDGTDGDFTRFMVSAKYAF